MRKLNYKLHTNAPVKIVWSIISDVDNYHQYIKYCMSSKLQGKFEEGSSWYDWSTVAFLPLKINHKIIKIVPNQKVLYKIEMPFGNIWQTLQISKTKPTSVSLAVTIDIPNQFLEKTLGTIIYIRNKKMLASTMNNFKNNFSQYLAKSNSAGKKQALF